MERIEFEDATLIKDAYVEIDGIEHTIIPAQTVGGTDLNKETFETLQDNFENAIQEDITTDGKPVKCGYKIDGKDVYVKLVECGYLKSGTTKIAHNINNIGLMYGYKGFFRNASVGTIFNIPRSYPNSPEMYNVDVDIDKTNINLTAGTNYDGTTFAGYVYIYFSYVD